MNEIESKLGYTREMLVSLALLLGCDYDSKGVPGCGVQMANKFLNEIIETERKENRKIDVLNLMRCWQSDDYKSSGLTNEDKIRKLVCNNKEDFPNEKIISEYLYMEESHKRILIDEYNFNFKWRRPSLKLSQVRKKGFFLSLIKFKILSKFIYCARYDGTTIEIDGLKIDFIFILNRN